MQTAQHLTGYRYYKGHNPLKREHAQAVYTQCHSHCHIDARMRMAALSSSCILRVFMFHVTGRHQSQRMYSRGKTRRGVRMFPAAISRNRRCHQRARGRGYRVYAKSPAPPSHICSTRMCANDVVHLNQLPRLDIQALGNRPRCSLPATLLSPRAIPVCTPLYPVLERRRPPKRAA